MSDEKSEGNDFGCGVAFGMAVLIVMLVVGAVCADVPDYPKLYAMARTGADSLYVAKNWGRCWPWPAK